MFSIVIFFYALARRLMCVETQTFHSGSQTSIEYTAICEGEVVHGLGRKNEHTFRWVRTTYKASWQRQQNPLHDNGSTQQGPFLNKFR
jgi:hypothetical protein